MSQINQNSYFLVNSAHEFDLVKIYIKTKKIVHFKLIATSKAAISEFLKKKVPFKSIECFTSSEELIQLGYENISLLSSLINYTDNFLFKEITKLQKFKIKPFKFNQFKLKILLDTNASKILFLKNFLKKTEVLNGNIFIHVNSQFTLFNSNGLFNEKVNLYSLIIDQFQS